MTTKKYHKRRGSRARRERQLAAGLKVQSQTLRNENEIAVQEGRQPPHSV